MVIYTMYYISFNIIDVRDCFFSNIVDWAPASLFLAQLYQRLGPFLEWGVAGDAVVVRWRDSALFDLAKTRYLNNNQQAHKTLLDYFQV